MAYIVLEQYGDITFNDLVSFIHDEFVLSEETDILQKAYKLADAEHSGKLRRNGLKYITHPEAVAELASILGLPTHMIIIAFLHDTYEDSQNRDDTANNIIKNFNGKIFKLVRLLSHDENESYYEYVRKLLLSNGGKQLFLIKICDMLHNSSDGTKDNFINVFLYLYLS